MVRRHRLLERWLVDVLGLDWAAGVREAPSLSTASQGVVERLDAHLDRPLTCPHGNPIPGRAPPRGLVRLDLLAPERPARVVRISEVAEHEAPQLLRLLHDLEVTPGRRVTVRTPGTPLRVEVDGRPVEVDRGAARAVWVAPLS